jgi:hypothetical protein
MNLRTLIVRCLLLAGAAASAEEPARRGPLSPADEAAAFRFADEQLTVEPVAAGAQVDSPVAIAWDADARLHVAEMPDYQTGLGSAQPQTREAKRYSGHGKHGRASRASGL